MPWPCCGGDLPAWLGDRASTCLEWLSGDRGWGQFLCNVGTWDVAATLGVFKRRYVYK